MDQLIFLAPYIILCMFGAVIGSFLNVCIYRMPEDISIVAPRSFCPICKKQIAWYDNIPFLSYIFLGGKCRHCATAISVRYVAVELLTAVIFCAMYAYYGPTVEAAVFTLLACGLIVVTFIDLKYQLIPDSITLSGIVIGIVIGAVFPLLHDTSSHLWGGLYAVIGMLTGGALIYATKLLGDLLFRRESMGGGDIKLLALIGAFLGWKLTILTYFIAPFFGSIVGLIMKYKYDNDVIAYGPYLSLATVITLFFGADILNALFMTSSF